MKKKPLLTSALLLVLILGALAIFMNHSRRGATAKVDPAPERTSSAETGEYVSLPVTATTELPAERPQIQSPSVIETTPEFLEIEAVESELSSMLSARSRGQALAELRDYLLSLPADMASKAIMDYLSTGRDAETGLPFGVGRGGQLASASSLRTFLMDLLGLIDPAAAASYAEEVFRTKTSAEEYALGLRNVAWAGEGAEETRLYVAERTRELLQYEPWVRSPTAGLAEAFDAVVWAGDLESIPILANHMAPNAVRDLNKPAFMAMDRLVIAEPEQALEQLSDALMLMDERPLTRAGFFARADPRDRVQAELAESYLLQAPAAEADYFINLYPNLNLMLSHNLLSTNQDYSAEEIVQRLSGALDVVRNWQQDPRFGRYRSQLKLAESRLLDQLQ